MVPVEVVVILLWLIFGLVGFVRRFPVELGATIGLTAMLFMIDVLGARLGTIATRVLDLFGASIDPSLVRWLMSFAVIGAWVIFMYGG